MQLAYQQDTLHLQRPNCRTDDSKPPNGFAMLSSNNPRTMPTTHLNASRDQMHCTGRSARQDDRNPARQDLQQQRDRNLADHSRKMHGQMEPEPHHHDGGNRG